MSRIKLIGYLSLLFLLAPLVNVKGQVNEPIHLSYNLTDCCKVRKNIDNSGKKHFFIEDEHFVSDNGEPAATLSSKQLDEIPVIVILDFLEVADQEMKRLIENGEKAGTIKVLFNDQVFDKIYLYEKTETGKVKKYPVIWIEEIE